MSSLPWSKFYWADWESDEGLKMCSPGAQALWMRMLCICAKSGGYLLIKEVKLGPDDMATQTGWPLENVRDWWGELERWGVFSIERRGKVYSRRLVKDAKKTKTARENGKNGGNPNIGKQRENGPSVNQNPTNQVHLPLIKPSSTHARINQKLEARVQKEESSEDKSSAHVRVDPDLDKWAWDDAIALLTSGLERNDKAARGLFGRIISANKLQARDLLPAIATATINATRDPASYLTKAAQGVAMRRGSTAQAADVDWC